MKGKVILRADGNSEIGLGHVIRSIALAEMLKNDFLCIFATRYLTKYLEKEILKSCIAIIQLPENDDHYKVFLSNLEGDEIVVLDNYFYDTDYHRKIKKKGCKLVCIDDIHDKYFVADAVINHAGGISETEYSTAIDTCLYLGLKYSLLRPEFLKFQKVDSNCIFISLGGADINNATLDMLNLLEKKRFLYPCYVVVGDAYLYFEKLEIYSRFSSLNLYLFKNISAKEMSNIMSKCKYAICAPSTVAYEYLSIRGGELYLKETADNQKDVYNFFIKNNIAFDISELFITNPVRIEQSIAIQKHFFDGKSKERILSIFKRSREEQKLKLRFATMCDVDLYFKWVNDPIARENATNPKLIPYKEHIQWFKSKIDSGNSYLWILERDTMPIGQIRFDINRDIKEVFISYYIDQESRGNGYGIIIIKLGLERLYKIENNNHTIKAIVKQSNFISRKVFEHFNFEEDNIASNIQEFVCYKKYISF